MEWRVNTHELFAPAILPEDRKESVECIEK